MVHNTNLMLQLRSVDQNILCILWICCKPLFILQMQIYPQLLEAEVKTKAQIWKTCDEKELVRRQAFYQDVLAQQQSVSHFYTSVCMSLHLCTNSQSHVPIISLHSSHSAFRPYWTVEEIKWRRRLRPPWTSLDRLKQVKWFSGERKWCLCASSQYGDLFQLTSVFNVCFSRLEREECTNFSEH